MKKFLGVLVLNMIASVFFESVAQTTKEGFWEITVSSETSTGGKTNRMPPQSMRRCIKGEELKNLPQTEEMQAYRCKVLKEERTGNKVTMVQECSYRNITYLYNSVGTYREDYMEVVTEMAVRGSKDINRIKMVARRIGDCK